MEIKDHFSFLEWCSTTSLLNKYISLGSPRPFDVTLRDGLQGLSKEEQSVFSFEKKKQIFHEIIEKNPQCMELGSIVSHHLFPIFIDTQQLLIYSKEYNSKRIQDSPIQYYILIPNIQKLKSILEDPTINCNHFCFITSVSNQFQLKNTKKTLEQNHEEIKEMLSLLRCEDRVKLYISCITECPVEGKIENQVIVEEIMKYNSPQIQNICLSDTMGNLNEHDFEYIIDQCFTPFCVENAQMETLPSLICTHKVGVLNEKRCKKGISSSKFSLHLHVDMTKKSTTEKIFHKALEKGITIFDVSSLKTGGCSMTMNKSQLLPNLSYELYYEFLINYLLTLPH